MSIFSCKKESNIVGHTMVKTNSAFTKDLRDYYLQNLDSLSTYLNKLNPTKSLEENKVIFKQIRKWYKYAEPFMIAFDNNSYLTINGPNLLIVHAEDYTDVKKIKPKSLQVVEELLYADEGLDIDELELQLTFLRSRVPFMAHNHIIYKQKDRHYLKMIRDEIITVATKGITGFDSPMQLNSTEESAYVYQSLWNILNYMKDSFGKTEVYKQLQNAFKAAEQSLISSNFETFDRYAFIKNHTNKQLVLLAKAFKEWDIDMAENYELNPYGENLFQNDFFNLSHFAPQGSPSISKERIALGKSLFNDASLSNGNDMSCATCHIKEKAFTDGHKVAIGRNGIKLQRNSPTLSYAVYQRTFFYDGRGDGLEGQIVGVTNNKNEFHTDLITVEKRVKENPKYLKAFHSLYEGKITNKNVRHAIATYIRSLAPFNSKFDRNMQGLENTITEKEVLGFNLFMGKAACATCHFPPTFNGTVPPKYAETEFENLGLTKNANFKHPVLDDDPGMYYPYEVEERRGFFKTSSVRNVELTAPYMHNGAFKTLEQVLEFYNLGGGQGMGLDVPYQTLPPDPLELNDNEINSIIAFMKSLTDSEYN
ncbi:cytochrome-c peroxidase [Hyunsoonleella pacifica]|nr:cytochrome c peroxidase [Hyunsoonleella pacifica]